MVEPSSLLQPQLALLSERCPTLCPSLFSNRFKPTSLAHLCSDESQNQQLKKLKKYSPGSQSQSEEAAGSLTIVFPTVIDLAAKRIIITDIKVCNDII
jgi:hypothetical protein